MSPLTGDNYLESREGILAQRQKRASRRFHFTIDDIEPRAKHSMPEADKDDVQRQLLGWLVELRRHAFCGPLALRLLLSTTDKTPAHSHTAAKNLLDLFATPRASVPTRRKGLLYFDDQQVHGLSVTCQHGEKEPDVNVMASPMGSTLGDFDLAARAIRERRDREFDWEESERFDMALDAFNTTLRDGAKLSALVGDDAYEAMLFYDRQRAQEHLLGRGAVTPFDLAMMYRTPDLWEGVFTTTPLRVTLSELPQTNGSSKIWRAEIEEKLRSFQEQFGRLINPLVVPVALEVIVKPPHRRRGLHDLDNVLRSYLIPSVLGILSPPSDFAFTFDNPAVKRVRDTELVLAGSTIRLPRPPASTRIGLTRYEAWRLPPAAENSKGFVSVAIVAEMSGHGDMLGQIEDAMDDWAEATEGSAHGLRRRRRRF